MHAEARRDDRATVCGFEAASGSQRDVVGCFVSVAATTKPTTMSCREAIVPTSNSSWDQYTTA